MASRLLFIGHVWPEVRSSGAGIRTLAFIEQAIAAEYDVHVAAPSKETVFTDELRALGVTTHFVQANDPAFDAWIGDLRPAIAILDRFVIEEQFGWRIREFSPDTAIVLDTIDLHSLRRAREKSVVPLPVLVAAGATDPSECVRTLSLARPDACREIAAILRSDLTLKISEPEKALLESLGVPAKKLIYIPFSYRDGGTSDANDTFSSRAHFVSIGNFRHPPNLDSVRLLIQEIWPLLRREIPGAELHLYGAYPPKEVMDRNGKIPGLVVHGPCDEAIPTVAKYRVLLAPLRFGAGIKGKISDAWLAGTPVCTTSIGAEGMGDERGEFPGAVADSVPEFVARAAELYALPSAWTGLRDQAHSLAEKKFSWVKNAAHFVRALRELEATVGERRETDFLQATFLQQSAAASKYLAKWIEAKNRPAEKEGERAK